MAAVQRYGPRVNAVAAKYGISGRALLAKLIKGESNFVHRRGGRLTTSSAGARGAAQFIPGTRAAFIQRYGVDAWKSPEEAVHAASIYLRKSGLAAYNPGMKSYSKYILGQHVGDVGAGVPRTQGEEPALRGTRIPATPGGEAVDRQGALRQALLSGSRNPLITAAKLLPQYTTQTAGTPAETVRAPVSRGKGSVKGKPIDRPGAKTSPEIVNFVKGVSAIYGHPITLGTGTNHSRMTVNGNVSNHWDGNALDLPARGQQLIRMGQAALIAAGWSPARAKKARGGLYNVGRYQIIFNTHEGGDHTDHLHVGRRG